MSLMELLVVLVIVGVLLIVSLPMYNNVVLKGNRQIAMAELRQVLARQEQFLQERKKYADNLEDLGLPGASYGIDEQGLRLRDDSQGRVYLIALSTISSGFLISAEPQQNQRRDILCGTISLQNNGRRFVSGSVDLEECW
jgi:type IV pilus assembly protein PilE